MRFRLYILLLLFFPASCQKENSPTAEAEDFTTLPVTVTVEPGLVDEASGLADSKKYPGHLWVEEDSGNPDELILLSHSGQFVKRLHLDGISNRDWEDMAIGNGPDPDETYIYLADIGNNNLSASQFYIYRFQEPPASADQVNDIDKIKFRYPDGTHDAEAILLNNRTRDLYIISKRDSLSAIYVLEYPQSVTGMNQAKLLGVLPFNGVVGAAFSPEAGEVLIKTYTSVYYWKLDNPGSIGEILNSTPRTLQYQAEPQGEAIAFRNDGNGFFTLSERPYFIQQVKLYFYPR